MKIPPAPQPTDQHAQDLELLVRQVQSGNREAFREIVLRTQRDLRVYLAWRLGHADLIEDVLQETLVAAYEHLDRYSLGSGTFLPWLRGISRHRALRALQAWTRQHRRTVDPVTQQLTDRRLDALERDTQDEEARNLADRLKACLDRLGDASKELIVARYCDHRPLTELAQASGRSANALSVSLMKIRNRLRQCLEQAGS